MSETSFTSLSSIKNLAYYETLSSYLFFLSISKLFALFFFFFFETSMLDLTHSFVDSFRTVFVILVLREFYYDSSVC